jgi:two-component system, sensor histidine kinase and response regulator
MWKGLHQVLSGVRVLAVDDSATNRRILKQMLANWDMRPAVAEGGEVALAAMEEARRSGSPFQLLVIDVHMPGMDGFTLVEQIRRSAALSGATIMMLSSADQQGSLVRCRELGIGAYLTKPIRASALREAIVTLLASADGRGGVVAPARGATSERPSAAVADERPLRILVAEDNAVNQKLAVALLVKRGHSVAVAANGRLALAALEREPFDLVLMDVQMPEMGGLEATAIIRERERTTGGHVPIIATTARAMEGDLEQCLEVGMDAYIAKPLRASDLFELITRVVPARDASASAPDAVAATSSSSEILDTAALLAAVDGDENLMRELVEIFIQECPRLMSEVERAVLRRDAEALAFAAHSLKGSLASLAAGSAAACARGLEEIGRSGRLSAVEHAHAELKRETAKLLETLTTIAKAT